MKTYYLSVLFPIPAAPAWHVDAAHRVHVLTLNTAAPLQWVREHADEIAAKHCGPGYHALMVRDELPADEAAALALSDTCQARGPVFEFDGSRGSLAEYLQANNDDDAMRNWLRAAAVGESFAGCTRVA